MKNRLLMCAIALLTIACGNEEAGTMQATKNCSSFLMPRTLTFTMMRRA